MGNEDLVRWGTRFYSMGNEVVRVYAVTCTETPSLESQEWVSSMESRLFQYSIPYFSFDNAKFHSIKLNFIRWGTRIIRWGTRYGEPFVSIFDTVFFIR